MTRTLQLAGSTKKEEESGFESDYSLKSEDDLKDWRSLVFDFPWFVISLIPPEQV
jgi:hypothetical protein